MSGPITFNEPDPIATSQANNTQGPTSPATENPTPAGVGADPNSLTISEDQTEKKVPLSGLPSLPPLTSEPPFIGSWQEALLTGAPLAIEQMTAKRLAEVSNTVLDAWSKSIEETGKIAKQSQEKQQTERVTAQNLADDQSKTGAIAATGMILILGVAAVGVAPLVQATAPIIATGLPSITAVLGTVIPANVATALSSLTSLFGAGILVQSTATTLINHGSEKTLNKAFLARTIAFVSKRGFEEHVARLLKETLGDGVSDDQLLTWGKIGKAFMLLNALAYNYKMETGGLSGAELKMLIENGPDADTGNPEKVKEAIALLNHTLSELGPKERKALLDGFFRFADEDPSFSALSDPYKGLKETLEEGNLSLPLTSV